MELPPIRFRQGWDGSTYQAVERKEEWAQEIGIDLVAGGDLRPLPLATPEPPYTLKKGSSLLPQACRASLKTSACRRWLMHFLKVIGQA